jgi:UDP-N-acetylglucosamine acyltransferase
MSPLSRPASLADAARQGSIHPTAVVDPGAEIGPGVKIGPYAIVGSAVRLADGVEVGPHAVLEGRVEIGSGCQIFAGVTIGLAPQDLKFTPDTPSGVRIGAETVLREYVTIHRATSADGWTTIGRGAYLMGYSHVGHDCQVGDHVILTSYTALTGFVQVGDRAVLSGLVGIHQFVRIGTLAFVSGLSRIPQDVPPYFLAEGNPAVVRGVNIVGLRRAGVPAADRLRIQRAYKTLYRSGLGPGRGLARLRDEAGGSPYVQRLVEFVEASKRGILPGPGRRAAEESEEADGQAD